MLFNFHDFSPLVESRQLLVFFIHSNFLSLSNVTSSFLMQILIVLTMFALRKASHFMLIIQDLFLFKIMLYQQDIEHKRNPRKKLSWLPWKAMEHLFFSFCFLKTLIIKERIVNLHMTFLSLFPLCFPCEICI